MRPCSSRRVIDMLVASMGTVFALCAIGCGSSEPATAKPAQSATTSDQDRRIDSTRAASAVGYDGEAVRRSVKATVDAREAQLKEAADAADAADNAQQHSGQ